MKTVLPAFFLAVGAASIISTYMYFRVPENGFEPAYPKVGIMRFSLSFLMLAMAGILMFEN